MVADVGKPRGKAMVNDPVNNTGNLPALPDDPGQFILYQTEDGQTRVEVRFFQETVWLSQKAMAGLLGAIRGLLGTVLLKPKDCS